MIYKFPYKGTWRTYTDDDVVRDPKIGKVWEQYVRNPMSFFLPHGIPWCGEEREFGDGALVVPPSGYKQEWKNDGVAFINDREHDICILTGQNQGGKTVAGMARSFFLICPTKKEWHCHQHHGIEWHEWQGPKVWIIASYSWDNVRTLWRRYRSFFPRYELGPIAEGWGKYPDERGRPAPDFRFGDGRPKSWKLACGSELVCLCYDQRQAHWEGFDCDGGHFDEQPDREKWVGAATRTITRGDFTPFHVTCTGHVMDDRPDTGAGGWLHRDMIIGGKTDGKTVAQYHLSIESTPDAIVSPKRKLALYDQWVNPKIERTQKDERAAVARYWGGWEPGSGLVFDEFDRRYHVINPLWDRPPRGWTKWRIIDYGGNGITCCAWYAKGPHEWAVCYRMYYQQGVHAHQSARDIIRLSGNEQYEVDEQVDETTGCTVKYYEETPGLNGEEYVVTLLDCRSMAMKEQGVTVGDLYERYGIHVTPSSGLQDTRGAFQALKEMLRVDMSLEHPWRKRADGTPEMGCPGLFFFDGVCDVGINEIEGLERDKNDPNKVKLHSADHFVSTAKWFAQENPQYLGDEGRGYDRRGDRFDGDQDDAEPAGAMAATPYTAY